MISDAILNLVHAIVHWVLRGILAQPDVNFGIGFVEAFAHLKILIAALNSLFPSATLFLCLSVIVVIEVAIMGFKATMFLLKKIPGIN